MEYRQLRSFIAVAASGSFNSAASDLNISQSALSYQIRCLEEHLQVRLFLRHARGVELSSVGQLLLPLAVKLVGDTKRIREMLRDRQGPLSGVLSIGVTPTPARLFIPDLLIAAAAETKIRLEVRHGFSGGHYADLVGGALDMALCYSVPGLPVLQGTPLYQDDVFLVGPPDMVVTTQGDLPFEELAAFPLVLTDTAHLARRQVEQLARERGITLNVVHEVDMIDVQRQLVIGHRRCTLASWGLFLDELKVGRLGGRRIVEPTISRTMQVFARTDLDAGTLRYIASKLYKTVHDKVAEQRSDYWWLRLPENLNGD